MTEFTTHKTCHEEKLSLILEITHKNTYFLSINWPWIFCRKETNKDLIRYDSAIVISNKVSVIWALLSLWFLENWFLVGLVLAGSRQDLVTLSKITNISARSQTRYVLWFNHGFKIIWHQFDSSFSVCYRYYHDVN